MPSIAFDRVRERAPATDRGRDVPRLKSLKLERLVSLMIARRESKIGRERERRYQVDH